MVLVILEKAATYPMKMRRWEDGLFLTHFDPCEPLIYLLDC